MAKYSFEFKKKVVLEYINGEGGTQYLSTKYGLGSNSQLRKWLAAYKEFGDEGLKRSRKKRTTLSKRSFLLQSYIYQVKSRIKIWLYKKELLIRQ